MKNKIFATPILFLCGLIIGLIGFEEESEAKEKRRKQKSLQVIGQIGQMNQGQVFVIDRTLMEKHSVTYLAHDPNFENDPAKNFRGITIQKILELTQAEEVEGVTFVANNAYVTYESIANIRKNPIMVTFEANGKPIKKNRGGPFMIMYPNEMKVSLGAYNWYIHTIVIGGSKNTSLVLESGGKKKTLFPEKFPLIKVKQGYPQPRGYKADLPNLGRKLEVQGVLLSELLKNSSGFNTIVLENILGQQLELESELLQYPIMVVTGLGGKSIHPAHGGSFPVIFPISKHPVLLSTVPKSGALYYLKRISLE